MNVKYTLKSHLMFLSYCQKMYYVARLRLLTNLHNYSGVSNVLLQFWRNAASISASDYPGSKSEIREFLIAHKLSFKKGFTCWHCSLTSSNPKGILQNATLPKPQTVFLNMTTGMFIDYESKINGCWRTFQRLIDQFASKTAGSALEPVSPESNVFLQESQYKEVEKIFNAATKVNELSLGEFNILLTKFNMKGLLKETFKLFDIRSSDDRNSLLFPYHDPTHKLSGIRTIMCVISEDGQKEFKETFFPPQFQLSIFRSMHNIQKVQKEVVFVSSVQDAMTVTQETQLLAIVLPRKSWPLPPEILPWFEKFSRVTLWFGSSPQECETTRSIAKKLGIERCFIIRSSGYPLSVMQSGRSILRVILESEPASHKFITSFHSLKHDVLQELSHSEQVTGTKWTRLPGLNKLLKGHRRGELTIFTGPTGSGKTTFMSEYSLDLCMQGVITLWGSFEITNVRLAKLMINQFSMKSLESNLEEFDMWSAQFEQLPLYFMTLHGQQNITEVLEVMAHAVYIHDIQHVVVDNLQFMMGMDTQVDRFWRQDLTVAAFRRFATHNNCHVTLVMHPRKENQTEELTINSIYGGAKASQEADNILILQDKRLSMLRGRKYIQVSKNRFDGDVGLFPIEFDKESKCFSIKRKPHRVPKRDGEISNGSTVNS